MKKSTVVIVLVVFALLGGISLVLMRKEDESEKVVPQNTVVTTTTDTTSTSDISIKNLAFNPSTLTVKKGTTVTWKNDDSMAHTVTSQSTSTEAFDSGNLAVGKTFSHTFATAGTFAYVCSFHPSMTATVVVTE